jgi:transcriptional regulator with XRE-family HTH domain
VGNLRDLRESRGLSQRDLARLAEVDVTTVNAIETGKRKPFPTTRRKLARALRVRPEAIEYGP